MAEPSHPISVEGSDVKVLLGPGALRSLGAAAAALGSRALLVTDAGIRAAGHVERALASLRAAGLDAAVFDEVVENPTTACVDAALHAARAHRADLFVGLGGGSSMDAAKGANFLLTSGGRMADYWGVNKAPNPMLPLIAIPTTAGTGSDAQSFALISDGSSHQKMACGDKKALPRLAILDPELTATQPPKVAAATGIDAISHAVESAASKKRTEISRKLSKQAWMSLEPSFETALSDPADADARIRMLLGAHVAGAAIENSMLGAAHACANPLTAQFAIVHGHAVGVMLPHVVRHNSADGMNPYADLMADAEALAARLAELLGSAGIPPRLREMEIPHSALPDLAQAAATQWTAGFNPRPVDAEALLKVYQAAW